MLLSFSGEPSVFLFAVQNIKMYKYQYIYIYIYIYIYVCVCVCVCVYIYIYMYHYPKWGIFCLPACFLKVYVDIYVYTEL